MINQSDGLEFIYDDKGLVSLKYNRAQYFYRKDAQGNIIAILDNNGNVVVNYVYDAWGNHAVIDSNGNDVTSGIGVLNPFRYRSYYYDTETELYYLQTRYYDPEVGRFINMDSIDYADPETINGLNLYSYCNNNPVMNIDPEGTWSWKGFWKIIATIAIVAVTAVVAVATAGTAVGVIAAGAAIGSAVGAVAGGASSAVSAAINGASGEEIFDAFADGALSGSVTGAASGGLSASGVGLAGQMVGNVIISGLDYSVNAAIDGNFNAVDFGISLVGGAVAGWAGGRGSMSPSGKLIDSIAKTELIRGGTKSLIKIAEPILRAGIVGPIITFIKDLT